MPEEDWPEEAVPLDPMAPDDTEPAAPPEETEPPLAPPEETAPLLAPPEEPAAVPALPPVCAKALVLKEPAARRVNVIPAYRIVFPPKSRRQFKQSTHEIDHLSGR